MHERWRASRNRERSRKLAGIGGERDPDIGSSTEDGNEFLIFEKFKHFPQFFSHQIFLVQKFHSQSSSSLSRPPCLSHSSLMAVTRILSHWHYLSGSRNRHNSFTWKIFLTIVLLSWTTAEVPLSRHLSSSLSFALCITYRGNRFKLLSRTIDRENVLKQRWDMESCPLNSFRLDYSYRGRNRSPQTLIFANCRWRLNLQ